MIKEIGDPWYRVIQTKYVVVKTYICLSHLQGCCVGGMFCRVEHSTEAAATGLAVFTCVWPLWGGAPRVGTDPVITSSAYSITQPHDGKRQSTATYHTGLNGTNTHTAQETNMLRTIHFSVALTDNASIMFTLPWNWFYNTMSLETELLIQSWLLCLCFTAFLWWRDSRAVADWLVVLLQRDAVWSPGQHGHERHLLIAKHYSVHCYNIFLFFLFLSPVIL